MHWNCLLWDQYDSVALLFCFVLALTTKLLCLCFSHAALMLQFTHKCGRSIQPWTWSTMGIVPFAGAQAIELQQLSDGSGAQCTKPVQNTMILQRQCNDQFTNTIASIVPVSLTIFCLRLDASSHRESIKCNVIV